MSGFASTSGTNGKVEKDLQALDRRAKAILKARPAYQEIVDFYLTVFRRQIEWGDRVVVHAQAVDADRRRQCLEQGRSLIACCDPGLEAQSLSDLWAEMKTVFRRGNEVLRDAVGRIDHAEKAGTFAPATWLLEQRPDRQSLIADAAQQIGIEESTLTALARAVTFPHWQQVARCWLAADGLDRRPRGLPADGLHGPAGDGPDRLPAGGLHRWNRSGCPVCGGVPVLAETRRGRPAAEGVTPAGRRFLHCSFCGTFWAFSALKCPACDSAKPGDAKYLFTSREPELRIDFCKVCKHYIKAVDGDRITGPLHVGLESLTTVHLDAIAREKNLKPLEIST